MCFTHYEFRNGNVEIGLRMFYRLHSLQTLTKIYIRIVSVYSVLLRILQGVFCEQGSSTSALVTPSILYDFSYCVDTANHGRVLYSCIVKERQKFPQQIYELLIQSARLWWIRGSVDKATEGFGVWGLGHPDSSPLFASVRRMGGWVSEWVGGCVGDWVVDSSLTWHFVALDVLGHCKFHGDVVCCLFVAVEWETVAQ